MLDGAQTSPARRAKNAAPKPTTARQISMSLSLTPLVSLLAGILILVVPRMLNYIVAIYLIVVGLLGLFGDVRLR